MKYDISEIGAINCTLNFDEDDYLEYVEENGIQNNRESLIQYVKEYCDYDVEYLDSEYFHSMGGYDSLTFDEIESEFGEEIANAVLNECLDGKEHSFELQLYNNDTVDIKNPSELNAAAVKYLRHGPYFKDCRGFILTNGVVVYTDSEHNQCSKIPGINGTFDFLELGNIRVLRGGVDIYKKPTDAQRNVLYDVFSCYYGQDLYLDVKNGGRHYSKKYNGETPEEILNDIYSIFTRIYESKSIKKIAKINEKALRRLISESIENVLREGF